MILALREIGDVDYRAVRVRNPGVDGPRSGMWPSQVSKFLGSLIRNIRPKFRFLPVLIHAFCVSDGHPFSPVQNVWLTVQDMDAQGGAKGPFNYGLDS